MTYRDLLNKFVDDVMNDPQIQCAIKELQGIVLARYPEARFDVAFGEEPIGVYVTTTVDVDDPEEVTDLYIHRLIEMQVEEDLPVHMIAVQPAPWERAAATGRKKYRNPAA